MTMGGPDKNGVRTSELSGCQEILDVFLQYGKELDTARLYAEGTTEPVCTHLLTRFSLII